MYVQELLVHLFDVNRTRISPNMYFLHFGAMSCLCGVSAALNHFTGREEKLFLS